MRKPIRSWTDTFLLLGLRKTKARPNQRKCTYQRSVNLEGLESRQMLATTAESDPVLDDEVVSADITARGGDFTLEHVDWSGRDLGGQVLAGVGKFGLESTLSDRESPDFRPGQYWSFRFDRAGLLMGIQFADFSVEDADGASLKIGDNDPIVIRASQLGGGFWRAPQPLKFETGDHIRLEALSPTRKDLEEAAQTFDLRRDELLTVMRQRI